MKNGRFKAKAIKGTQQFGLAGVHETPQIAIDVDMAENGSGTSFLFFSQAAAPYSFERLKLAGWTGEGPQDLDPASKAWTLFGSTEFDVDVAQEEFQGKTRQKIEILTGASRVKLDKPVSHTEFLARLRMLGAGAVASTSKPTGPAAPAGRPGGEPPF